MTEHIAGGAAGDGAALAVIAAAGIRPVIDGGRAREQEAAILRAARRKAACEAWVPAWALERYEAGDLPGPVEPLREAIRSGRRLVLLHGPRDSGKSDAAVVAILDGDHPGGRYVRASRLAQLAMSKERAEHADASACRATTRLVLVELGREHHKLRPVIDSLIADRLTAGRLTVCTLCDEIFPPGGGRLEQWYPESAAMRGKAVVRC